MSREGGEGGMGESLMQCGEMLTVTTFVASRDNSRLLSAEPNSFVASEDNPGLSSAELNTFVAPHGNSRLSSAEQIRVDQS